MVDFALGTDTGGSVRVPASFCGIFGIRPTHGRLPFDGVAPQAPSFDTVGWFARSPHLLARIAGVLLGSEPLRSSHPKRVIIAEDAFAVAEPATRAALLPAAERVAEIVSHKEARPLSSAPLAEWLHHQTALQGWEAWATFGDWIDRHNQRVTLPVVGINNHPNWTQ